MHDRAPCCRSLCVDPHTSWCQASHDGRGSSLSSQCRSTRREMGLHLFFVPQQRIKRRRRQESRRFPFGCCESHPAPATLVLGQLLALPVASRGSSADPFSRAACSPYAAKANPIPLAEAIQTCRIEMQAAESWRWTPAAMDPGSARPGPYSRHELSDFLG